MRDVTGHWLVVLGVLSALLLSASPAFAHKPSDAYVTMRIDASRVDLRWDIALRDLNDALDLDRDGDGAITWGELDASRSEVVDLALRSLRLDDGVRPCPFDSPVLQVTSHSDGAYAALLFSARCPEAPRTLYVDYELFFGRDPQHHGIVRYEDAGGTRVAIFKAEDRRQSFERAHAHPGRQLAAAIVLGIEHIFHGLDHLLFLIALLLPSVVRREGSLRSPRFSPVPQLRPALADVLRIVTSFTVAHSITLTLSALEILRLPSRLVESAIAASVVLAAANNVVPLLGEDRWVAAFALGLLHGFGFSATLLDLGLPRQNLIVTLFGFNVGVEIGQLAVVASFFPLAYLARRTRWYRTGVLVAGSVVIAAVASVWLVERALAIRIG